MKETAAALRVSPRGPILRVYDKALEHERFGMLREALKAVLQYTPVGLFPVRVRRGMAANAKWTLGPFSANWRYGGAEDDVCAAARQLPNLKGRVFWDFGAHFGIHSVGLAMHVGPTGQVVAFEPDPVAYARLKRHIRMNALGDTIIALQAAASARDGQATFYLVGGGGTSNSHFKFHATDVMPDETPQLPVETVRPDGLVERGKIRLPDLIKVDVQGHGGAALAGSAESIRERKPVIAYSNHSRAELEGARSVVEPLGYKPFDLKGRPLEWADVTEALLLHEHQAF